MKLVLGIGCDRHTAEASIAEAVRQVLQDQGVERAAILCIATIDIKGNEPGLLAFAKHQGWPLRLYPAAQLARVEVPNPSEVVRRHTGTPAVAEAAALLAANATWTALLVEKHKYRDAAGKNVTVSLARVQNE